MSSRVGTVFQAPPLAHQVSDNLGDKKSRILIASSRSMELDYTIARGGYPELHPGPSSHYEIKIAPVEISA